MLWLVNKSGHYRKSSLLIISYVLEFVWKMSDITKISQLKYLETSYIESIGFIAMFGRKDDVEKEEDKRSREGEEMEEEK